MTISTRFKCPFVTICHLSSLTTLACKSVFSQSMLEIFLFEKDYKYIFKKLKNHWPNN